MSDILNKILAVKAQEVDAARALLAGGAKAQCKTAKGATPLHFAAQNGATRAPRWACPRERAS